MRTIRLGCPIRFRFLAKTVLLLLQTSALLAQTPTGVAFSERQLAFEHLTIDDGLSQNYVKCIFQDSKGFMWFGATDGLNRYDGHAFKVYSSDAEDSTSISTNDIQAINEDRQGNIWIGTANGGLNKYDRATDGFVHYKHDPKDPHSLSHNGVRVIHEDRLGNLWIGAGYGLNRFDPKTAQFTRFIYKPDDQASEGHNDLWTIFETGEGNFWLGTEGGVVLFDPALSQTPRHAVRETFTPFEISPAGQLKSVRALYKDGRGNLWVGAFSGLFRANPAAWQPNPTQLRADRSRTSSRDWLIKVADYPYEINAICEDEEGKLWLASTIGLFIYDIDKDEMRHLPNDPRNPYSPSRTGMTAVFKDRSGVMWLGTAGQGIDKLNRARQRFGCLAREPNPNFPSADNSRKTGANGLRNPSLRAICEDRDGALWLGGYDGLNRFDRKTGQFTHYPNRNAMGYGGENVWVIYEDPLFNGDRFWIGTEGGGLYRLDRQQEKFHRYQNVPGDPHSLDHNFVMSIYRDQAGTLWVGTAAGLNKVEEPSETPMDVAFKQYNYSPTNPFGPSEGWIMSICESRYNNKRVPWLATGNGLNCFDPATEQFTRFFRDPHDSKSLSHNAITCLHQDRAGRLWIGTADGLNRMEIPGNPPTPEEATFIRYTEKDGLPNNFINGILEDEKGNLWLSTNNGISQFNPETETFRNYDAADGLQSREFNRKAYYQCRHGEMFFGGINGLNMFFPRELKDNPHRPPVVFTDFKILNKSVAAAKNGPLKKHVTVADEIRLSYDDYMFSFEFAALEYTAPEKNQYAYKLEGYRDQWIQLGTKREATFTNLDPGEYVLRVKGSNNDGVWNEAGASLKIIITPPWWKTWWAYTLYGVIFFGAFYGLRRYEMNRKQLKHDLELKQVLAEKQQSEAEKMKELDRLKSRFFANISHEFRTPLTLIMGQLESMKALPAEAKLKTKLDMAWRNARQLLRLINQLLDLSKLEAGRMELRAVYGNIVPLLQRLTNSFESLAGLKRIQLRFASASADIKIYHEPEKIEKIMQNLLSNALKFTPEGGKVSVQLSVTSDQLSVTSDQSSVTSEQSSVISKQSSHDQLITDHCLLITVRDTGIGIPKEHLPHVFDRFFQVDGSATREHAPLDGESQGKPALIGAIYPTGHEGTGIGLALTKELVELHGGEISVTSEQGFGATFVVRLPFSAASDQLSVTSEQLPVISDQLSVISNQLPDSSIEPPATSRSAAEIPTWRDNEPPPSSDKEVILIVEDNADVRSYLREHLEDRFQVWEAGHGEEGLAKAQELVPDLVITDVMMPKMDGYTFSKHLKSDEKTSHIPIIMLTARAEEADKIAGLEIGVDDYLIKPFSPNELRVRVRNLVEIRRRLRERFSQATLIKPSEVTVTPVDQKFLERLKTTVEASMGDEDFDLQTLSAKAGMSERQLERKLKALINQTPNQFIRSMRLQRAKQLLEQNAGTVSEIAYMVGFNNIPYFSKAFREAFGKPPSEVKGEG